MNPTLNETCARIEEAATDVLTLIEGLDAADYARSRLTRAGTVARLRDIAHLAAALPPSGREAMPEVDWAGWQAVDEIIGGGGDSGREWAAATGLAAITLQWMRVYRQAQG